MKQPKKLTRDQKKLLSKCGLNPENWMCLFEDNTYLHIVDKGVEQRELRVIDKTTMEIVDNSSKKLGGKKMVSNRIKLQKSGSEKSTSGISNLKKESGQSPQAVLSSPQKVVAQATVSTKKKSSASDQTKRNLTKNSSVL